jgi:invasion protein IalB
MSLWVKIAGGVVLLAAAAAVGIFVFGIGTGRSPQLTSLVKSGEGANRASPGSEAGQSRAGSAAQDWQVNCKGDGGALRCLATQSVRREKTGQLLVSAEVRNSRSGKQPLLRLKLPLNVDLEKGVRLRIGGEPAKALKIQTCLQSGCTAATRITEAELAAMLKGEKLAVSMKGRYDKTPVTLQISGGGFDKAYAKLN